MAGGYPWNSNPEKVDRRAWVRDHLAGVKVREEGLPSTIIGVVQALAHLADPNRIILFGSRARGEARTNSDFDLYVEGIRDRGGFDRAKLDAIGGYLTLRPIDIVPEDEASEGLKELIAKEGIVLYERTN